MVQQLENGELFQWLNTLEECVFSRSLLWMIAKTTTGSMDEKEQASIVMRETFIKEFSASQINWSHSALSDHRYIWMNPSRGEPHWAPMIRRFAGRFLLKVKQFPLLYPKVQRSKNTSKDTARNYCQLYPDKNLAEVRTVDLEVHYFKTGQQIKGDSEMRQAWKFNDLKPRFYYCMGGSDYWASRYMKPFAVALMDASPGTTTSRRVDPSTSLFSPLDEFLTTWDYSAFTSTLSELKFFLYHVAELLRIDETVVECLSYRNGPVFVYAHELLHAYNDKINTQSAFSIHRLARYIDDITADEDERFYHQNSGPLGVPGNIGFSTALHGWETCKVCGEKKCVCVGDDALGSTADDPNHTLIPHIRKYGDINARKWKILHPYDTGPIPFLKRGLTRDQVILVFDLLLDLPISPYIDGLTGLRTVLPDSMKPYNRLRKIAGQTGALLWRIREINIKLGFNPVEMDLLYTFLDAAYARLKLPRRGFLPGFNYRFPSHIWGQTDRCELLFALPSLDFALYNPAVNDWLEFLFETCLQQSFLIPIYILKQRYPLPDQGDKLLVAEDKLWKMLEDIGTITCRPFYVREGHLNAENKRLLSKMFVPHQADSAYGPAMEIEVVDDVPTQFHSLFMPSAIMPSWGSLYQEI